MPLNHGLVHSYTFQLNMDRLLGDRLTLLDDRTILIRALVCEHGKLKLALFPNMLVVFHHFRISQVYFEHIWEGSQLKGCWREDLDEKKDGLVRQLRSAMVAESEE